jgi:hypothetical protein
MGDYLGYRGRKNRCCPHISLTWEETKVLEWKPRFTAILVVLTLVLTAALASGYAEWFFDNWEW